MVSRDGVNGLLDDRARLVAKNVAAQANLFAAEFLLHRIAKLLPHLIADSPHNAVHRDTILEEIAELLAEDREHPGATHTSALLGDAEVPTADAGDAEQGRTT